MLELPESTAISLQMAQCLTGKTVAAVTVAQSPHRFAFYSGIKEQYPSLLFGQTVRGACHHGGIVELDFDSIILYFSDGAYPRYTENGSAFPKKHQLLVEFSDGSGCSVSVQMYGYIGLAPYGQCAHDYYRSSFDKPEPLTDAFTFDYFKGLYNGSRLSAKAFLATEQRIPGLGNGVLQDILWNAGIDPRCDMRALSESDFQTLYSAVRSTLADMVRLSGRNTERDFFGNAGGYTTLLSKDTLGMPCPRCGGIIEKAAYMGGAVYYCPGCQMRR